MALAHTRAQMEQLVEADMEALQVSSAAHPDSLNINDIAELTMNVLLCAWHTELPSLRLIMWPGMHGKRGAGCCTGAPGRGGCAAGG